MADDNQIRAHLLGIACDLVGRLADANLAIGHDIGLGQRGHTLGKNPLHALALGLIHALGIEPLGRSHRPRQRHDCQQRDGHTRALQ